MDSNNNYSIVYAKLISNEVGKAIEKEESRKLTPISGIIALFLYLAVAKATTQLKIGIILPSVIVVWVPFAVETFIKFLLYGNSGLPIENIISVSIVGLAVVQFAVALFVFWRLQYAEDSVIEWLLLVASGGFVIMFLLPFII